jgi:vancomycin permeability regulator SanA
MQIIAFLHRVLRAWRTLAVGLGCLVILDLSWTLWKFPRGTKTQVSTLEQLPAQGGAVLVLGAGVMGDGGPTRVLEGRLRTALALWKAGKVRWFLVSGDNRTADYNEPQAMRRWLIREGVPRTLVIEDYAGRRTYDSLRRARAVFGLRRCVIVTSDFHLPRALFLADLAQLQALGVAASTSEIEDSHRVSFWTREYFARHKALWDAWFPPDTRLGPREATPEDLPSEAK